MQREGAEGKKGIRDEGEGKTEMRGREGKGRREKRRGRKR